MLCRHRKLLKSLETFARGSKLFSNSTLSNDEVRIKRNLLFDEEAKRQTSLIARYEKIQVKVVRPEEKEAVLIMNKKISTPLNCAMHLSETISKTSAVALVNGRPWDMHRPLDEDCVVEFIHYKGLDPRYANKAYWRSCCFLLGMITEKAFKDNLYVEVHSWPTPDVRSGSFVCDVDLKVDEWKPREDELRTLSGMASKLFAKGFPFQVLDVDASVALKIFEDNQYKKLQIPCIAAASKDGHTLTLYRVDNHIDISGGPMISNTNHIGRFMVSAVFPIQTELGKFHRFQGVSVPNQIFLHHVPWDILVNRARNINTARFPTGEKQQDEEFETPLHQSSLPT